MLSSTVLIADLRMEWMLFFTHHTIHVPSHSPSDPIKQVLRAALAIFFPTNIVSILTITIPLWIVTSCLSQGQLICAILQLAVDERHVHQREHVHLVYR
jgi:hypothetical protein